MHTTTTIKPVFNCVKIGTAEVLRKLEEAGVVPSFDVVKCSHITLEFKPDSIHDMDGQNVTVIITGLRKGEEIEALNVRIPEELGCVNEYSHITLSHAKGVSPVKSNDLLPSDSIADAPIIQVTGVVCGWADGDYMLPEDKPKGRVVGHMRDRPTMDAGGDHALFYRAKEARRAGKDRLSTGEAYTVDDDGYYWVDDGSDITFSVASCCDAFNESAVGSKVVDTELFLNMLKLHVSNYDPSGDRTPGQHFVALPEICNVMVQSGEGRHSGDPGDYVVAEHRGRKALYLGRHKAAKVSSVSVVVYTYDAYCADSQVTEEEAARIAGCTHVIVALIAAAGPSGSPVTPHRFLENLKGGNADYSKMDNTELMELGKKVVEYWGEWGVVADGDYEPEEVNKLILQDEAAMKRVERFIKVVDEIDRLGGLLSAHGLRYHQCFTALDFEQWDNWGDDLKRDIKHLEEDIQRFKS